MLDSQVDCYQVYWDPPYCSDNCRYAFEELKFSYQLCQDHYPLYTYNETITKESYYCGIDIQRLTTLEPTSYPSAHPTVTGMFFVCCEIFCVSKSL